MTISNGFAILALLGYVACTSASAQDVNVSASRIPIELFTGPEPLQMPPPHFPRLQRDLGTEGWAFVNFMIDPAGKPQELVVTDSSGNLAFEEAALRAIAAWTFKPATLNGRAVEAGHSFKITFRGNDTLHEMNEWGPRALCSRYGEQYLECRSNRWSQGVRWSFRRKLHAIRDAIEKIDEPAARAAIASMRPQNLFESALRGLAEYDYAVIWGNDEQRLQALRRAIASEKKARFMQLATFNEALESMLLLEVKTRDYASALKTWDRLRASSPDDARLAKWAIVLADMEKLRVDSRSYAIDGQIVKGHSWFYPLFKRRFNLRASSGRLDEIKLRCDKQYVFFRFDPTLIYEVADRFGNCQLEVVGASGSEFELIQL